MKITERGRDDETGMKKYLIDFPVWDPIKKRGTHIRRVAVGSSDLAIKIAEIKQLSGGSLTTTTFGKCVAHTIKENGGAGMSSVYDIVGQKLGVYRVDRNFVFRYEAFIDELKDAGKAINTISNYKSCIQHVLKKAWRARLINDIPIRDFDIKRRFRSRIWSQDERTRIFNQLDEDDNLFWMLHFSERNPIRKMDLVNLTRENLVLIGEHAPYIRFQPKKTAARSPQPCILVDLDAAMLARFADLLKRFPDCPYLFPAIYKNKQNGTERWEYQGNPRKHFAHICDKDHANVDNFHFHDLKHVAITRMLKAGTSRDVLKKRGIQLSDRSIDVYDETDAFDTIAHRTFIEHGEGVAVCAS
jgi:integrase